MLNMTFTFTFITTSAGANDSKPASKRAELEKNNMIELEKFCHINKRKYETISDISKISKTIKNVTMNESEEKHKYFIKILNKNDYELLNEEKGIEIYKLGS